MKGKIMKGKKRQLIMIEFFGIESDFLEKYIEEKINNNKDFPHGLKVSRSSFLRSVVLNAVGYKAEANK